jgi:hypothetical protein
MGVAQGLLLEKRLALAAGAEDALLAPHAATSIAAAARAAARRLSRCDRVPGG